MTCKIKMVDLFMCGGNVYSSSVIMWKSKYSVMKSIPSELFL